RGPARARARRAPRAPPGGGRRPGAYRRRAVPWSVGARGFRGLPGGPEPRVADGRHRPICISARGIRFPEAHEPRRGGSPSPCPPGTGDREAIPSRRARSPWPLGRAADRERTALMATRPRRLKPRTPPARGRVSTVSRQTKETSIELTLALDGQGTA